MDLRAAAVAAEAVALVSGIALVRRRPSWWPVVVAVAVLLAVGLARGPLNAGLSPPQVEPWTGGKRVLVWIDGALELATFAAIGGSAVVLFADKRTRGVVGVVSVWAALALVLAWLYPAALVRGASLQRVYIAIDLGSLFAGCVAVGIWARHRRSPTAEQVAAFFLMACDGVIMLAPSGPWRSDVFATDFSPVALAVLMMFLILTAFQGVLWRRAGSS
jgi:hypothetical protein